MKITNGLLFTESGTFQPLDITFDRVITAIEPQTNTGDWDATGCCLVPGFLDIHTHGGRGEDASDGSLSGLRTLSRYYAEQGVTGWCPTTMTLPEETLTTALTAIRLLSEEPPSGAKCLGVNLEGPFLSYGKRGAQAAEHLRKPDADLFDRLNEASGGQIRLVTVAPEEEGALDLIRRVSQICTVSLGHSSADYDTALRAYEAGATHTTHLFNGMAPLHHRAPAILGAAWDAHATVELICDGYHLHPAVVRLAHRLYGEKMTLISDSIRCAGMPDGAYTLGGQPVLLQNGVVTMADSPETLAGSACSVLQAVRNAVSFGIPLEDAILAATKTPAEVIGAFHRVGSLSVGKAADLLVLDQNLQLRAVFVDGKIIANRKTTSSI